MPNQLTNSDSVMANNITNTESNEMANGNIPQAASNSSPSSADDIFITGLWGENIGAKNAQAKTMPEILPISKFNAEFTNPRYLVSGMIQEGYLGVLTAKPGGGKTALLARLASDVANGSWFCGRRTKQRSVIYMAGENPDDTRYRFMGLEGVMIEDKNGPFLNGPLTPPFRTSDKLYVMAGTFDIEANIEKLVAAIDQIGDVGLIVIDTLVAYNPMDDENDSKMQRFINKLRPLCETDSKPAVIIAAHPNKSATKENMEPRGSSSIMGEVDYGMKLWRKDQRANVVELSADAQKFRGKQFDPVNIQLRSAHHPAFKQEHEDDLPYSTVVAHYMPPEDVKEVTGFTLAKEDQVLKYINENQHTTRQQMAEALNLNPKTVTAATNTLVSEKKLEIPRKGQYRITTKGKKHLAALADEKKEE